MKIIRSTKIQQQIKTATKLRNEIINKLISSGMENLTQENLTEKKYGHPLIHTLCCAAESFKPILSSVEIINLDRRLSMLPGPFFTTYEYSIPTSESGNMLPLLQINLNELSQLRGEDFGDGLLQIWCDPDWQVNEREFIRIIPSEELILENLTEFDLFDEKYSFESNPIPDEWTYDYTLENVMVITGYESLGIHAQTSRLENFGDFPEEYFDLIFDKLENFKKITEQDSEFHLFGSFYPIHYDSSELEAKWNCLVSFSDWGVMGNAQVFYYLSKDGSMSVYLRESLR